MRKFWAMKTFQEWWSIFNSEAVVGIDQDALDRDYNSYSDAEIHELISSGEYTEYIDRIFREFCKWMQVGDLIIVGTGQVTDFKASGIVRIAGDYYFEQHHVPRYLRRIEVLKAFDIPRSMIRFSRTSRLELIDENAFYEAILSLL